MSDDRNTVRDNDLFFAEGIPFESIDDPSCNDDWRSVEEGLATVTNHGNGFDSSQR